MNTYLIRRIMAAMACSSIFEYLYEPSPGSSINSRIEIPHSLGKKPKMLIGLPEGDARGRTSVFCGILCLFDPDLNIIGLTSGTSKIGCAFQVNNGGVGSAQLPTMEVNATSITITGEGYTHGNVKIRFFVIA